MLLNTNFTGRIFQVVEALDYGDAVSNQVISLNILLKEMGFTTAIFSQWHHAKVDRLRSNLDELNPTDMDLVILHYVGYSEYALPYVQKLRCTTVCVYHNITPHTFFEPGTDLYDFCLKGRQQLQEVIPDFHYFWGDSKYNLQELIALGANPHKCSLVPIIVGKQQVITKTEEAMSREAGSWLFLGRIAANKGQINLVKLFANVRADDPGCARKLYIVGNHNPADPYFQKLLGLIKKSRLSDHVILTGKVSDTEVEQYLARASVYVSMSEHEGFGVPLIEAAHHGLAVVALRNSAIAETMNDDSLANNPEELIRLIKKLLGNDNYYKQTVALQKINAMRFSPEAVKKMLINALQNILPDRFRFTTVSIVICTYDRCDLLERCLDYLQYQTNQNFEVVVINGPSTDKTEDVLEKYRHRIKIARNPERNLSKSRNMGIELSDGDLIAFIDDDALPFDDWVATLMREFGQRPLTHAAIGGPAYFAGTLKFQAQDIGINKLAIAKFDIDSTEIGRNGWERSMLGTNTCFRANIIREVRGFDEQFDYFLDESELSFRLQKKNYIVGYAPELFLRHEFAQSENRGGKYKFNWFTICKNTAYFISAYSGLKDKDLSEYIDQRMNAERVMPLENGCKAGEIPRKACDEYIKAIQSGTRQGLADATGFPRTRELKPSPALFQVFTCAAAYPMVGRDIDPLHICIITKEFPPFIAGGGGIGTLYYHLASELLLMGHHVTVIAPGDFKSVYRQGRFSVQYEPIHAVCADSLDAPGFTNNTNWSISAFHAVSELHANHPIDVVDSALWDSEALALSLIPREQRPPLILRLVTPFPVAARLNGWQVSERESAFFNEAEKALIQNADVVVPISESIARTIENEHAIQRDARWIKSYCGIAYWPSFDVVDDYADLKLINGHPLAMPKEGKLILFLGRLEKRKGVDLLLEAAKAFLASNQQAHLVLAGKDIEGWSNPAKTNFPKKIVNRIHFVGEVDDSTRDKLLNAAYCVVFPSRYESFGLVPLEAFVHSTPVIAMNAGAIAEVVADEECGLLFEAENSEALAKCVTRLLTEPQLHARLAAGARKQIRRFSSRNSAINSVRLYANLLLNGKQLSRAPKQIAIAGKPNVSSSHSSSYEGSHPRLQTQCGQRIGKQITSTGVEGYLFYGPYVDLPVGNYKVAVYGQIKHAGTPKAYIEVIIDSGASTLASQVLSDSEGDAKLITVAFSLSTAAQIEIRVWIAADADVSIRKLVILSEQDFSD